MSYKTMWLAGLLAPMMVHFSANAVDTQIATSQFHSLFIAEGNVYAMGNNSNLEVSPLAGSEAMVPTFTQVKNAQRVAANYWHSAALLKDGTVTLWGKGPNGLPSTIYKLNETRPVTDIAHSFDAFFYVVDGEVFKWNYSMTSKVTDAATQGRVKQIAAGFGHLLIQFENGDLRTTGDNTYGQLGTMDNTNRSDLSSIVLSGVTNITTGQYTSIAITQDGMVYGFGKNTDGQLGLGHKVNVNAPTAIPNLTNVKKVMTGMNQTVALLNDGTLRAAGWHNYIAGAVYNVNTTMVTLPPTNVQDLGGSGDFVLLKDNTPAAMKGWGGNLFGKLGDGTNIERHTVVTSTYTPEPAYEEPVVVAEAAPSIPETAPEVVVIIEPTLPTEPTVITNLPVEPVAPVEAIPDPAVETVILPVVEAPAPQPEPVVEPTAEPVTPPTPQLTTFTSMRECNKAHRGQKGHGKECKNTMSPKERGYGNDFHAPKQAVKALQVVKVEVPKQCNKKVAAKR